MAITPEQRLARRNFVGSSDAWKLFADPLSLYNEKVFDLEEQEVTEAMGLGNRFEAAILDECADQLGVQIQKDVHVQGPEPWLAANLDAVVLPDLECLTAYPSAPLDVIVAAAEQSLEAKFTGLGHLFGQEGTDAIPERVIFQAHHGMLCLQSLELAHVPVLLARFGRPQVVRYEVPRNNDLIEILYDEARRFWEKHVIPRVPPPPSAGFGEAAVATFRRMRRTPGLVAVVDRELVEKWQEAQKAAAAAEKARDEALAAVLSQLVVDTPEGPQPAEAGDFGDPDKILTYHEQKGRISEKKIREAHPELFTSDDDAFRGEPFRVPRVVKR